MAEPQRSQADENPWYILATLYGRPDFHADSDNLEQQIALQVRNRVVWNRYMASRIGKDLRDQLLERGKHGDHELNPLTPEEMHDAEIIVAERLGAMASIGLKALQSSSCDLSNVIIQTSHDFKGLIFPPHCKFSNTLFMKSPIFTDAYFTNTADFSGVIFQDSCYFDGVTFAGKSNVVRTANFLGARFSGEADFTDARFYGATDFGGSSFAGQARFERVHFDSYAAFERVCFLGTVDFERATFNGNANFREATFSSAANFRLSKMWSANFGHAVFLNDADFGGAQFSDRAYFAHATFRGRSAFINAEMNNITSFSKATFSASPPSFFGARLHEGTLWHGVIWPQPPRNANDAEEFVADYERLKLEMDRLRKHDDELNFFALELKSRETLVGFWQTVSELRIFGWVIPIARLELPEINIAVRRFTIFNRTISSPSIVIPARTLAISRPTHGLSIAAYGVLCDYGRSYVRPFVWLVLLVILGALLFWFQLGLFAALGMSFANTLAIIGVRREFISSDVVQQLPGWLIVVAALQDVVGISLIFLLGLALRNRFRIK